MAETARMGALWLLGQVLGAGRLISELTGQPQHLSLSPPDRARAKRLALDSLRGLERADRVLKPFLRKSPPLPVRNTLRLATVELCAGGDAHGIVNEAVEITRQNPHTAAFAGLVNAVLRKVAREGPAKWVQFRVPHLPKWLRGPLSNAWGGAAIARIEAAHFAGAPLDVTVRANPREWAAKLGGNLLPTGSVRLAAPGRISELPGYETGDWWIQDAAAALPVRGLGDVDGLNILDIGAAPGGKTLQLAAGGARVTALDVSDTRMQRLHDNLDRTGLKADVVVDDILRFNGQFDAVVLDAPCSATGTIRRHPELPLARDGGDIGGLIELQAAMLEHALGLLKPNGRLIYCTCSLLPDEGECQVEAALARHSNLRVASEAFDLIGIDPAWHSPEGGLRLRPDYWPEQGGMDGFYMACLTR